MIEVAGAPILEHSIRRLVAFGFHEIVINLHHCPDSITDHFGRGERFGASISYSFEDELLGTAGALKNIEDHFREDDFLLLYGDNLTTCDFAALMHQHKDRGADLTMAVLEREDPRSSGIVELQEGDRITRFREKPARHELFSRWVNAGIFALSPSVLDLIPPGKHSDFGKDILEPMIRDGFSVYGYRMGGKLWWIDTLEDYKATCEAFTHPETLRCLNESLPTTACMNRAES
jgi:mannose-1-phosphate guanylyltransferase